MTMPMPKADTQISVPPVPPPAVEQDSFVINLCSSTTPMALTQPQLAELKRFSFFVSRRLEDGRERFRLHMGYFDSLLQAEELLPLVRDIYPGAWAGEAPGKRLRARGTAPKPTPAPASAPAVAVGPGPELLANMPTLSAAPDLVPPAPPASPVTVLTLELVPDPVPPVAASPPVAAAPVARESAAKRATAVPFDQRSNVREVLNSLDEAAPQALPKAPIKAPPKASAPVAPKPATPKPAAPKPVPAGPVVRQPGLLPESQVLHLLEEKRGDPLNTTSTPAAFSIQLQWSVQPIDLPKVPALAIFGAYTLYTVEGSREGRRWFGLRLGFFSDANSAKQVAQYVRSEFSSVAVVPVSLKERDGASGASGGSTAAPQRPTERLPDRTAEFKLLDDTDSTPKLPIAVAKAAPAAVSGAPIAKTKSAATGRLGAPGRAGHRNAKSRGNRVNAHERRSPQTLEETLEILGAGELQMEGARKELVSEGGIRHLDVKVQKNSPFSRLLDRLAERGR